MRYFIRTKSKVGTPNASIATSPHAARDLYRVQCSRKVLDTFHWNRSAKVSAWIGLYDVVPPKVNEAEVAS